MGRPRGEDGPAVITIPKSARVYKLAKNNFVTGTLSILGSMRLLSNLVLTTDFRQKRLTQSYKLGLIIHLSLLLSTPLNII